MEDAIQTDMDEAYMDFKPLRFVLKIVSMAMSIKWKKLTDKSKVRPLLEILRGHCDWAGKIYPPKEKLFLLNIAKNHLKQWILSIFMYHKYNPLQRPPPETPSRDPLQGPPPETSFIDPLQRHPLVTDF